MAMKVGDKVYYDSMQGIVPAVVLAVDGNDVKLRFTATRGAFKKGMVDVYSARHVVLRSQVHVRGGQYRIRGGTDGLGAKPQRTSSRDALTRQYVETALWSSVGDDDRPLDKDYDISNIAPEALDKMEADVHKFYDDNAALIDKLGLDDDDVGHNFWLSRNGHGTGFFDLAHEDQDSLDRLQDAARDWGNQDLYIGDDGFLYVL